MKNNFNKADELDGFDNLSKEDKHRVEKAWQDGHVTLPSSRVSGPGARIPSRLTLVTFILSTEFASKKGTKNSQDM